MSTLRWREGRGIGNANDVTWRAHYLEGQIRRALSDGWSVDWHLERSDSSHPIVVFEASNGPDVRSCRVTDRAMMTSDDAAIVDRVVHALMAALGGSE